ncbi:MAG: hypothetical protein ABSG28_04875 [Methanoregula sp.]|uniref:hypothetical protein n=1 Tax=Methanoregula sp. TaxID=2052170 RepID=UPI003C2556A5
MMTASKCMDMRMEKAMCDFQAVMSQCMAQCMETGCREMPGIMSDYSKSRMKKALSDLQMMIPRCMSECMTFSAPGARCRYTDSSSGQVHPDPPGSAGKGATRMPPPPFATSPIVSFFCPNP